MFIYLIKKHVFLFFFNLLTVVPTQWGTVGTCSPLLQIAGHGNTVSRRTANEKLTILYWPSRKRSPKRLISLLEPQSGGHDQKQIFPAPRAGPVPHPTFKFVPAPLFVDDCVSEEAPYLWSEECPTRGSKEFGGGRGGDEGCCCQSRLYIRLHICRRFKLMNKRFVFNIYDISWRSSKSTRALMYDCASCRVSYLDSFRRDSATGTAARSRSNATFNVIIRRRSRAFANRRRHCDDDSAASPYFRSRDGRRRGRRRRVATSGLEFDVRSDEAGWTVWMAQIVVDSCRWSDDPTSVAAHKASLMIRMRICIAHQSMV